MIILLAALMGIPTDTGNPMMWMENQPPSVVMPVVPLNIGDPPEIYKMGQTYWICRDNQCAPVIPMGVPNED